MSLACVVGKDRMWQMFALILTAFVVVTLLSWPIVFSFSLWVLNDRGNLLNLDYLLGDGLRLGIDTFYSYGLLPVALQHLAFAFGRGYGPMLAFTVAALTPAALIWAALFRRLPPSAPWTLAVLCIVPMLLWVNPNFPYTLALLSMLGTLALVADWRLDLALAMAAIGCWSVPSLPLVLAPMVLLLIIADWWTSPTRSLARLARMIAPGALTYLGIGVALALFFGWRSVAATALPFAGAAFYAKKGYGWQSLHEFLSPADAGLRWYFFTRSGWWMASTVTLFALMAVFLLRMVRTRTIEARSLVVVMIAVLHAAFVFVAPGPQAQHIIYDALLAGGVLLGLAELRPGAARGSLLATFCVLALLGNSWQVRDTWRAWRDQRAFPATAGLYADPAFAEAWTSLVDLSTRNRLLMLTYATGVHHYVPTIDSPRIWVLEVGQLLPADEDRVLAQMEAADVIVTYPSSRYLQNDARLQDYMTAAMCLGAENRFFRFWQRRSATDARGACPLPQGPVAISAASAQIPPP